MRVTITQSWILSIAVAALAGCATGHDGDVNIGGGQSPDPVVLDIPVAYIKAALPVDPDDDPDEVRELETFLAGSDVWLRDRAAPDSPERNITFAVTGGLWNVRDVDGSYDGNRLVFAMRMPLIPGALDSEQPTWTSGNTTARPTCCVASSCPISSPRKATTSRRITCPTAASFSPRRASASRRRC